MGAQRLVDWGVRRQKAVRALTITTVVAPMMALVVAASTTTFGTTFPTSRRDKVRAIAGCVVADVPTGLIELDVLTSDLQRSCPVWVDLTGLTYDRDAQVGPDGRAVLRIANRLWQRDLIGYLTSGSATVLLLHPAGELSAASLRMLRKLPLVATTRAYRLYGRR